MKMIAANKSATDTIQVAILEDENMLRGLLSEWLETQPNTQVVDEF
jgi:hypothetical protein